MSEAVEILAPTNPDHSHPHGNCPLPTKRFAPGFLSEVVDVWLDTVGEALERQLGLARAEARMHARLRLAVLRGLSLDLLTTGDRVGVSIGGTMEYDLAPVQTFDLAGDLSSL